MIAPNEHRYPTLQKWITLNLLNFTKYKSIKFYKITHNNLLNFTKFINTKDRKLIELIKISPFE